MNDREELYSEKGLTEPDDERPEFPPPDAYENELADDELSLTDHLQFEQRIRRRQAITEWAMPRVRKIEDAWRAKNQDLSDDDREEVKRRVAYWVQMKPHRFREPDATPALDALATGLDFVTKKYRAEVGKLDSDQQVDSYVAERTADRDRRAVDPNTRLKWDEKREDFRPGREQ